MKIYVVDFEEVLKNFIPYHKSLKKVQIEKKKFSDDIEFIKKEMEGIISSSRSLLLDEKTQYENANRFKELQAKAIKLESDFRSHVVEMQNEELESNYTEISDMIQSWAKKADIDIVISKSSTVFTSEKIDATDAIINLLKENNLYYLIEEVVES